MDKGIKKGKKKVLRKKLMVEPRNDYVIVHGIQEKSNIVLPDISKKDMIDHYEIENVGSRVEGLKYGDVVLISKDAKNSVTLFKDGDEVYFMMPDYFIIAIDKRK